jgi:hypothetical protein
MVSPALTRLYAFTVVSSSPGSSRVVTACSIKKLYFLTQFSSFFVLSIFAIVVARYTTLKSPKTFSERLEKSIEFLRVANNVTASMYNLVNTIRLLDER